MKLLINKTKAADKDKSVIVYSHSMISAETGAASTTANNPTPDATERFSIAKSYPSRRSLVPDTICWSHPKFGTLESPRIPILAHCLAHASDVSHKI